MKSIATLFLVIFLASGVKAQKPISIETVDFLFYQHIKNTIQNIITPYSILDPLTLGIMIGAGDTNMFWDFSKVSYTREEQAGIDSAIAYPSDAPFASDSEYLKASTILMNISANKPTTFSFLRMSNDGIYNLGMTQDSDGISSKISGWSPPFKEMQIPIRYESTWQSISTFTGASLKSGEIRTVAVQAKVDGWGTMLLPKLYPMPALRVKKQIIVTDSKDGSQITIDTTFEYDFISYFAYQASIITDSKNIIQSAEYSADFVASGVSTKPDDLSGFTITENPATDAGTKVIYTLKNDGPVEVEIMDELGRNIRMLQNERASVGQHIITIDPGILNSGAYFVRIVSPEMTAIRKLIISR